MADSIAITLRINGVAHELSVEPRRLLVDAIRENIGLTGTHIGCEHGVCGTCTVLLDGESVRSCLLFAVQADGHEIMTVEGLTGGVGAQGVAPLHPLQEAFRDAQGLQCGFCTPGMLLISYELLQHNPSPSEAQIRQAIAANLCRCTGYQGIVEAVQLAAERRAFATIS
jgi:carbon-monoxide dehydrogenase small subunit